MNRSQIRGKRYSPPGRGRWAPARRPRGHTLPDVLLGMLVFAVTALMTCGVQMTSASSSQRSRSLETGTQAARREMDRWRRLGYAALPLQEGVAETSESFTPLGDLPLAQGKTVFTRLTDTQQPTTLGTGRCRVAVTVSWSGRGADRGHVTLTTLLIEEK